MSGQVTHIWRYPIKSHGREGLNSVTLTEGHTMPWDRAWAVAHEAAKTDGTDWAPCANFSRGAKAPNLMAISAKLDETREEITLSHPDRPDLTFQPDRDTDQFLDWVHPLMPVGRAASARMVRVPNRGMTDTPFPSISLNNFSSLRAFSQRIGQDLSPLRFRGNIWMDGLGPWEEFEWIGKKLRIGSVVLEVVERIERCLATTANPETGQRDADTLGALTEGWGHKDFGVHAVVIETGTVSVGDSVERI
jgi:uncharacterized protein YcbX